MKLYVDDIRNAPDENWTVARTVLSAIRAIKMFDFDEISLDHDISHQVAIGSLSRPYPCDETFEAVALYIAEKYHTDMGVPRSYPKITLHTSNPVGAEKMKGVLAEVGIPSEIRMTGLSNRLEMETL